MSTRLNQFVCGAAALLGAITVSQAQLSSPAPVPLSTSLDVVEAASAPALPAKTNSSLSSSPSSSSSLDNNSSMMVVQASTVPPAPVPVTGTEPDALSTTTTTTGLETDAAADGGVAVREFQGDEVGPVLRLLARQAKINMVVSDQIPPATTVTMRLEDVTALQAIAIIVKAKGLFMDKSDNVYYIKTATERTAEPTESDSFQLSYARAKDVAPLMASQLQSKDAPQVDERTNTIFYRETSSNIDLIRRMLVQIDKPTKQVMIEARLVEVTANPRQSYGINWAGVASNKTLSYGAGGSAPVGGTPGTAGTTTNNFNLGNPANNNLIGNFSRLAMGQFAILSIPQMSITIDALNQDSDAEFLANPRVVTADNQQAKIEITTAQPVPQLTFNEQTAQSVFGGFEDKKYGNTLVVRPSVNKDNFITLAVKPEISNKVRDEEFAIPGSSGGVVRSPVIDTRSLESNVLIKSGDTLAIGGLLQDETIKTRTKVPIMGDVPVLGYLFQHRSVARVKRNLLVFVTPTIIDQSYGTGLEDQVNGLHHVGEEYADPNGWRNNAKGAVRLVPTSHRQRAADYPKPGTPPAPARTGSSSKVRFLTDAKDRDF
jgi:type IV pilus secretin PilQ/predicted competence protein